MPTLSILTEAALSTRILTEACQIIFHLSVNRHNYTRSAIETSLQAIRNGLAEKIRRKAKEATIDVFLVEGEGRAYSLKVSVVCWLKNPSYNYVICRFISKSIGQQQLFYSPGKIRIYKKTSDAVRQSYVSPSPQGSKRWLHHSIVCSKAHNMPIREFVESLGKTVKREEMDLRSCTTMEQVMNDAWRKQILLYSIHGVLLAQLSSGQLTAPQGVGPDVGTTAEAAFPYPQPLNAASTTMHSAATTGAAGAVHPNSAETVGTTPQTGRNVSSEMNSGSVAAPATRKKLHYDGSPDSDAAVVGAPAPVEVSVLRESHGPSGDSQVHDTSTAMNGQSGITASQFCVGCRKVQVDLKLVAGAKKKRGTHKRAGRRHRKHNISSVAGDASTEGSPESTPEKKRQPDRVRPACASTTPAIETKRANDLKRQRSCSPAREPDSGLFVDDFGDYAREYQAACDVYANVPAFQGPSKSPVHERKYYGLPTSGGKLSSWATHKRQDDIKVERREYQNLCASRHCEKALLINNPFVKACQCSRPSAGDMLC
jgi:hypothetical protein